MVLAPVDRAKILPSAVWKRLCSPWLTGAAGKTADLNGAKPESSDGSMKMGAPPAARTANGPAGAAKCCAMAALGRLTNLTMGSLLTWDPWEWEWE